MTTEEKLKKEIEHLKNILTGFQLWGTDSCTKCERGRITLYVWNKECLSCNPKSYEPIYSQLDRLQKQNKIMKEALTKTASFGEGPIVTSLFDEPGSAEVARNALKQVEEIEGEQNGNR